MSGDVTLWTRGGVARGSLQDTIDRGETDPVVLAAAVRQELDPVNLPIYVQALLAVSR